MHHHVGALRRAIRKDAPRSVAFDWGEPMALAILGESVDSLNTRAESREPSCVRGEARRPGLARPHGRLCSGATPILRSNTDLSAAGDLVRAIPRPNAGCASRRPPGSLRPAPCARPAPGQNSPARLRAALARAIAPARHAAAALLAAVAALWAVSVAAQAQTLPTFVSNTEEAQPVGAANTSGGICGRTPEARDARLCCKVRLFGDVFA